MKIFMIGDLHLTPNGERVRGQDTNEAFDRGWREVAPLVEDADFVVVNGDISQNACIEGYRRFAQATQAMRSRLLLTAGNHDDRATLFAELGADHADETGHVQMVRHAAGSLIVLDTLTPGRPVGTLCAARLDWLRGQLDRAGRRPVIAVMHHPPVDLGIPALDEVALREGRDELLALLSRHTAPVTIVAGHHHMAVSGHIGELPYLICPAFAGPPAQFGLWRRPPVFGPGRNGACALTLRDDGRVDTRVLML